MGHLNRSRSAQVEISDNNQGGGREAEGKPSLGKWRGQSIDGGRGWGWAQRGEGGGGGQGGGLVVKRVARHARCVTCREGEGKR